MRGTIDQVEAFFGAITSVWSRVLSFFLASWIGFVCGIVSSCVDWKRGEGFTINVYGLPKWYLVPVSWMSASLTYCAHWWGLLQLLFLMCCVFSLIFLEADLFTTMCLLFVVESSFWWCVTWPEFDPYYLDHNWHPLIFVLILLNGVVGLAGLRAWRNNHASD